MCSSFNRDRIDTILIENEPMQSSLVYSPSLWDIQRNGNRKLSTVTMASTDTLSAMAASAAPRRKGGTVHGFTILPMEEIERQVGRPNIGS